MKHLPDESARNIPSGVPLHETAPFGDSEIVWDEHRPGDPFRESDLDGPVAVLVSFRTDGRDLE
jgi:hypothetical protein